MKIGCVRVQASKRWTVVWWRFVLFNYALRMESLNEVAGFWGSLDGFLVDGSSPLRGGYKSQPK